MLHYYTCVSELMERHAYRVRVQTGYTWVCCTVSTVCGFSAALSQTAGPLFRSHGCCRWLFTPCQRERENLVSEIEAVRPASCHCVRMLVRQLVMCSPAVRHQRLTSAGVLCGPTHRRAGEMLGAGGGGSVCRSSGAPLLGRCVAQQAKPLFL